MTLDTPDALLLDQILNRVAGDLKELGDSDTWQVRRARAVGILADPQHALDLMSGRDPSTTSTGGSVNLFVHLTPDDLHPGTGAAVVERLGAITTDLLHDWLTRYSARGAEIVVRPVLTTTGDAGPAVDQHDPPDWMRETVLLRDTHCVFPGCTRDSRSCDLDHIVEYLPQEDGGPPGQTRAGNLAPLCRTHHRIKTHSRWSYRRHRGRYIWTSPTGHCYPVAVHGRRPHAR